MATTGAAEEDMDIQMLLLLQKICNQKSIKLPWDEVGSQLGGTITAGAIIQHLAKLRARRVEQGLPVPDPLKRGSGGNLTLSTGSVNSSGGTRKGRQGKRLAASSNITSNEDDDDEEEFDVDKASDPEAAFGEVRKKRVKRDVENEFEEDNHGTMTNPQSGQSNKNSKIARRTRPDTFEATKKNPMKETSPEATRATVTERTGRRTNVNYARLHNGGSEYDTDDETNEPHVAAGSSFLKLEGVESIALKEESVTDPGEGENAENNEEVAGYGGEISRDASMSVEQKVDDINNITVLHVGKSERSLEYLKALGNSYTLTAPLGYTTSAVAESFGHLPPNINRRASMDLGMSGVGGSMPRNNWNNQYNSNAIGMNFRFGHHSQYHTSPYIDAFPGVPYSSAMPELMNPPRTIGQGFPVFPRDFYGNEMGGGLYGNQYAGGRSVNSMTAPQTPVSGGGFPGHSEYASGGNFGNALPSHVSPSNALVPNALPSQILRSSNFSSLSDTRTNSMSTSPTTNGQQYIQNYGQDNNQAKEMDFSNGEKLTDIYSSTTSAQQNPTLGFDTALNTDFLGVESFDTVFDRFVGEPDGEDL
ncbi:hypothetical protein MMC26_003587 [Xylographa opegraphella]|nr:hypothetical protein [Xylographa opegraphella]